MRFSYAKAAADPGSVDFDQVASFMLTLMYRNVARGGWAFTDPQTGVVSLPGCIVASPSYENSPGETDEQLRQDYVYNWTRDSAIVAIELAAAAEQPMQSTLADYVSFAATSQQNSGAVTVSRASYYVNGQPRLDWSNQSDGPALRILAVLAAYGQLDGASQTAAQQVVETDLAFLLGAYQSPTVNLWEEVSGLSFFASSVQLRCVDALLAMPPGITITTGQIEQLEQAQQLLRAQLAGHWQDGLYVSVLDAADPKPGYDPNIDIVLASNYGAVSCTDPQLLATAAQIVTVWADPSSATEYPINAADAQRGFGPLLGRYPSDVYDGDGDISGVGHPWAMATCAFAQLYYAVAAALQHDPTLLANAQAAPFFLQAQVDVNAGVAAARSALTSAGDRMLRAVLFHSDNYQLSEQFDRYTGYEKSVDNLTWSYAAFLSAVRARHTI